MKAHGLNLSRPKSENIVFHEDVLSQTPMEKLLNKKGLGPLLLLVLVMALFSHAYSAVNIGVHTGFKFATDTLYKEVYGSSSPIFGVIAGIDLFWKLQLIGEYNYQKDKGSLTISGEETIYTNSSWNIGLRAWIFTVIKNNPYVGAGVTGYSYHEDLPERFKDFKDKTLGFYLEIGNYFPIVVKKLYLDLNFKYEKVDVQPFDDKISLGGVKTTLGIRYYF